MGEIVTVRARSLPPPRVLQKWKHGNATSMPANKDLFSLMALYFNLFWGDKYLTGAGAPLPNRHNTDVASAACINNQNAPKFIVIRIS